MHDRFELAVLASRDGIWDWDIRSGKVHFSHRWCEIVGYRRDEIASRFDSFPELVHPDDREAVMRALNDYLDGSSPEYAPEFRMLHRDGSVRWIRAHGAALRDEAGKPYRMAGSHADITDQRALELERDRFFTIALDLLCVVGVDGTFRRINPAFERVLGWTIGELSAKPVVFFVHPGDQPAVARAIETAGAGGCSSFEARHIARDGSIRWLAWSLAAADGEVVYGSARDITERKTTELMLRESEERFRALADAAPILVWMTGVDGSPTYFNRVSLDFDGESLQETLARPAFASIHPDDRARVIAQFRQSSACLAPFQVEYRREHRSLGERWLLAKGSPRFDADANFEGYVGMSIDITEMKHAGEAMKLAHDAALESARAKSQFLANMSHEIRTPMNGVIGMTALLADSSLDQEQRQCVDAIAASADALLTLIDDILDFSKIEAGKIELEAVDFDLRQCLEESVELFAQRAEAKGLTLSVDVERDVPALVTGDPTRIRQIVTNLVGNAIKFTASGEVVVSARVDSRGEHDASLRFEVRDTGIGISADAIGRLFQAFVQADGSTTRKFGGTGLGLVICKQLAELMGGAIGVTSDPGQGSTFWFTAKLGVRQDALELDPRFSALRVLCVDDDERQRTMLAKQLGALGVRVDTVGDGPAAMGRLYALRATGERYDALFVDLTMPIMDGVALARAIKADPGFAGLPVVLVSSWTERGQLASAQESGIKLRLTKPVRYRLLSEVLRSVLDSAAEASAPTPLMAPSPARTERAPISQPTRRRRLLLAEDNEINRVVATKLLQKLGCDVDVAHDGAEAVAMIDKGRYDLVLMDCQMPVCDGYEATREIRKRGLAGTLPIIAMTANAMEGDREKCLAAGMDDYLSKPVRRDEIVRVLEEWTRKG